MMLRHGDEIALGSTRARYETTDGRANRLQLAGPLPARRRPAPRDVERAPVRPRTARQAPRGRRVRASRLRRAWASGCQAPAGCPRGRWARWACQSSLSGRPLLAAPRRRLRATSPRSPRRAVRARAAAVRRSCPTPVAPRASAERASTCSTPRAPSAPKSRRRRRASCPSNQIKNDPQQLKVDYERLRLTWELTRDIGLERDLDELLRKILLSLFKFVNADRGVILLRDDGSASSSRAPLTGVTGPRRQSRSARPSWSRDDRARRRAHPRCLDGLSLPPRGSR